MHTVTHARTQACIQQASQPANQPNNPVNQPTVLSGVAWVGGGGRVAGAWLAGRLCCWLAGRLRCSALRARV